MDLVVRSRDRELHLRIETGSDGRARVFVRRPDGGVERELVVDCESAHGALSLLVDGRQVELAATVRGREGGAVRYWVGDGRTVEEVEVLEPLAFHARRERRAKSGGSLRVDAYMPGRVVQVLVAEGASVAAGQGVLVLEAMKMENEIASERAGVVRRVFVTAGQAVEMGDPLFELAEG